MSARGPGSATRERAFPPGHPSRLPRATERHVPVAGAGTLGRSHAESGESTSVHGGAAAARSVPAEARGARRPAPAGPGCMDFIRLWPLCHIGQWPIFAPSCRGG